MSFEDLYPSFTSICDYAYDDSHPLRHGYFPGSVNSSETDEIEYNYEGFPQQKRAEESSSSLKVINLRAVALFDFTPENDNEIALTEGQSVWITHRHGQGWLIAEDSELGKNGLVPEEYVDFLIEEEDVEDDPRPFMPELLRLFDGKSEDEWEDLEEDNKELPSSENLAKDSDVDSLDRHLQRAEIS